MKIICVGRNYVEHIEELNNEKPKEPIIFFKPTVSLNKSTDFSLPEFSNDIHHEIEIIFEIKGNINFNLLLNIFLKTKSFIGPICV